MKPHDGDSEEPDDDYAVDADASDDAERDPALLTDDPVVNEARKRFDVINEWEAEWRQRALEDIRFTWGDSQNGYQWPNEVMNLRERSSRPCLTMNLIRAHNKLISNEARKNKSAVKFLGVGNGATQDSASCMEDIYRYIEYHSAAQHQAYPHMREGAIECGQGWSRLVTRYTENDGEGAWNQDAFIEQVDDPLSVYCDPNIKIGGDGLDSRYLLIIDDVPKDEFKEAYPELQGQPAEAPLGLGSLDGNWVSDNKVRVCEYFRKVPKKGKLISFIDPAGRRHTVRHNRLEQLIRDREAYDKIIADPITRLRDVVDQIVEWYLIVGERIVDRTTWAGKYIPLFRMIGEETVIEGKLDRRGHTRWMMDAQRMFNYNASAQVEFGALQTKSPWLAPADAIEEYEAIWRVANTENPSILPWRHKDPENPDVPIPPPQRIDPPNVSPAYQQGMENARQQIMMVSGQYDNQLGDQGNERTGAAINARQKQSATANFHFQDNYEASLVTCGKLILDIVPHIYDTKRVMKIINDDGIEYDLELNPAMRGGYLEQRSFDNKIIKRCLNPRIGKFDVAAGVGPSFDTRRDETVEALTIILTQAPALTSILGDILLKSMSFQGAQEAALRLRRMVPPVALGEGPTNTEQQQQQMIAALRAQLVKLLDKNAKDKLKLAGKDELRDIEVYDAETKRIAALSKLMPSDPEGLKQIIDQIVHDSLETHLTSVAAEASQDDNVEPPVVSPPIPGAQKAPDGEWYLTDPTRKGKYLHVAPPAQFHTRPGVVGG